MIRKFHTSLLKLTGLTCLLILLISEAGYADTDGFTREDRNLLIEMKTTLNLIDKRFNQIDKRFEELREDSNIRFNQIDKRFEELREDMNRRFEQVDKRIEQVDKRIEQVDKRFEQMMQFLWMLTGIFSTLTISVIGFAYWDRRTIISKAKFETLEELEKTTRLKDFFEALRKYAAKNSDFADILKHYNLL